MIDIAHAINALHPNCSFTLDDNDYSNIHWIDIPENPATLEQVNAKLAELQADYDSKQYQRDRASAYPSIQDQLDKIYHSGLTAWKADIKAVKDKFPKP